MVLGLTSPQGSTIVQVSLASLSSLADAHSCFLLTFVFKELILNQQSAGYIQDCFGVDSSYGIIAILCLFCRVACSFACSKGHSVSLQRANPHKKSIFGIILGVDSSSGSSQKGRMFHFGCYCGLVQQRIWGPRVVDPVVIIPMDPTEWQQPKMEHQTIARYWLQ